MPGDSDASNRDASTSSPSENASAPRDEEISTASTASQVTDKQVAKQILDAAIDSFKRYKTRRHETFSASDKITVARACLSLAEDTRQMPSITAHTLEADHYTVRRWMCHAEATEYTYWQEPIKPLRNELMNPLTLVDTAFYLMGSKYVHRKMTPEMQHVHDRFKEVLETGDNFTRFDQAAEWISGLRASFFTPIIDGIYGAATQISGLDVTEATEHVTELASLITLGSLLLDASEDGGLGGALASQTFESLLRGDRPTLAWLVENTGAGIREPLSAPFLAAVMVYGRLRSRGIPTTGSDEVAVPDEHTEETTD